MTNHKGLWVELKRWYDLGTDTNDKYYPIPNNIPQDTYIAELIRAITYDLVNTPCIKAEMTTWDNSVTDSASLVKSHKKYVWYACDSKKVCKDITHAPLINKELI